MSRIDDKFVELKKEDKTAFIGFITSGDPTIEKTKELALAMEAGGCDIIELGVPYSDPLADGPVIQEAGLRAFANGINVKAVFDCVESIRKETEIPLVFLLYFNTIFSYGIDEFMKKCSETGIDGLIIPDLPLEERGEVSDQMKKYHIDLIPLVTPTSKDRIKKVIEGGSGFTYCVSSMGVTGSRTEFDESIDTFLQDVKNQSSLPIAVGFGIGDNEAVKRFSKTCDGVIVGSAIVKVVKETNGDVEAVKRKIAELKG